MFILFINSQQILYESISLAFNNIDPTVKTEHCQNLETAIQTLRKQKVDYVFLDLDSSEENSLKIFDTKEAEALPPIIILSANNNPQKVLECLDKGAKAYLTKSASLDIMQQCINEVAKGNRYLTEELKLGLIELKRNPKKINKINLTPREKDILVLISKGYNNKEISKALNISYGAVKKHLSIIIATFDAENRSECVTKAIKLNII